MTNLSPQQAAQMVDRTFILGGLKVGGAIIMETQDELVIELPCGMFIRTKK